MVVTLTLVRRGHRRLLGSPPLELRLLKVFVRNVYLLGCLEAVFTYLLRLFLTIKVGH